MKKNKIEKIYEDTVFSFAFNNKIDSENAERKFLEYYDMKHPNSVEEKSDILQKVSVLNDFVLTSRNYMIKQNKLHYINYFNTILSLVASVLFLYSTLYQNQKYTIVSFAIIFLSVILGFVSSKISNKKNVSQKAYDQYLVESKLYKESVDKINKDTASDYFKKYYNKNPEYVKEFIYTSIESSLNSNFFSRILSKAKTLTFFTIFIYLIINTFIKNSSMDLFFRYAFTTSIALNLMTIVVRIIVLVLVNIRYSEAAPR